MADGAPPGWHAITPRIFVEDPAGLVAFLRMAFDATGDFQTARPTELWIGDSVLMIAGTAERERTTAFLYVYVRDADATYRQAIAAGAVSRAAPRHVPYGDRRAMVEDAWGNTWQIATRQRERPPG
jgi:PhnB protein